MLMSFKYSNCLKVVFDHLRFSFNASNALLMCRISVKYQYTIQAVCAYAYVFQKIPGNAHIGACALIRKITVLIWYSPKKKKILFYTIHGHFPIHKASHENEENKKSENTNNFGTTLFLTF